MKDIINKNKGLIRAVIRKFTGSYNEDIEQEVYIKTWRNLDNYHEEGKFKTMDRRPDRQCLPRLFQIKAVQPKQCRSPRSGNSRDNADCRFSGRGRRRQDAAKLILKAVDELPPKMRKVIILYEFEELSLEQIAQKPAFRRVPLNRACSTPDKF